MRPQSGYVRAHRNGFSVVRARKLGSIVPSQIALDELCRFFDKSFPAGGNALLDLGAGTKPYSPVYRERFGSCTAVDVPYSPHDISHVDVLASADELPFGTETFDCIVCTEVLEHCPNPGGVLAEMHRVLRPGGFVFLTTPFLVPLHEMPHDYYRFTPSALQWLAQSAGLSVVSIRPKGDYLAVALNVLSYPWAKFWQVLASRSHLPLYHPYNPLVGIPVVLPQLAYLAWWRYVRRREHGALRTISDKLSYITLGYITILERRVR